MKDKDYVLPGGFFGSVNLSNHVACAMFLLNVGWEGGLVDAVLIGDLLRPHLLTHCQRNELPPLRPFEHALEREPLRPS